MTNDYTRLQTPLQALRAVLALGVDHEGDIIVPGKAEGCDELNLVKQLRRIVRDNRGAP